MVRSLRKVSLEGARYCRRPAVEAEIQELMSASVSELERRASLWPSSAPGFVSPEALLYFVRNAEHSRHRQRLLEQLLQRIVYRLPRVGGGEGHTDSLIRTNIRDDVIDHFIDLLLSDQAAYDERLDYYEVNFNSAIVKDRRDASVRHRRHEHRSQALGDEGLEISVAVEAAVGGYDPFQPEELDKENYRLWLDEAIDELPELQQRIVQMVREDIPIDSKDPTAVTISRILGKSEKTIRTHRDKALAALRLRLDRKGTL
ncbi:hypothetical protein GLGCALEP_03205 [Pseudomonas sp. MM221]|nr:hypothetical protein DBADOPDK_03133 [Pseudomonas sp. MM223]CAI3803308.1 hypothetical protein GLGCALEP_03205 [Pseudomonas sp. MM221]